MKKVVDANKRMLSKSREADIGKSYRGSKISGSSKFGDTARKEAGYVIKEERSKQEKGLRGEKVGRNMPMPGRTVSFEGGNVNAIPATKKISMVKEGVSKNDLNEIKEICDIDYETLSKILSVSRAKLINKKGNEKFDQNTSERIMHLKDVIDYGHSVFEDKDTFNEWMKKKNMALGGKTPLELMDTIYGTEEVKREIGRIEYGVF